MLDPGTRIADRYTVLRLIGMGGMGGVYEIRGDALANRLALKVIRSEYIDNAQLRARLEREAKIQSTLDHPGIARVIDLVDHEGSPAIVMEYVDAPTLQDVLAQGLPAHARVREILMELTSALDAAHERGIVHRDIKPENVFVVPYKGGRARCKLIDFGIARQVSAHEDATKLTRAQSFVGTYAYASPEQITASGTVDARSDLYSLGVLLWEMLSGVAPYDHLESGYSMQVAVVNEPLPHLPSDVPPDLATLVAELTRKSPDERPQTASEVLGRLGQHRGSQTAASGSASSPQATVLEDHPGNPASPRANATVVESTEPHAPQADGLVYPPSPSKLSSHPPSLLSRLFARSVDEVVPQLLTLTCVGIILYPFLMARRGMEEASTGQTMFNLRLMDSSSGRPASPNQVVARNLIDLFVIQLPLLGVIWPVSWVVFPLPLLAAFWLMITAGTEIFIAAITSDGRRVADYLCGTRMETA